MDVSAVSSRAYLFYVDSTSMPRKGRGEGLADEACRGRWMVLGGISHYSSYRMLSVLILI